MDDSKKVDPRLGKKLESDDQAGSQSPFKGSSKGEDPIGQSISLRKKEPGE